VKANHLAAGYGSRLAPIIISIPKCLVQILGSEIFYILLPVLKEFGISDVQLNRKS